MTVLADIRRYLHIRQLQKGSTPVPPKWKHLQAGGGHIVKFHGHTIYVRETPDESNNTLIFVSAGRLEGQRPCFMMDMNTEAKTATLISLERGSTCFIDAHESTKDLVRVAVMIANQRGIRELELTDNSTIQCPQKVHIADLSFLSTGKTWYESILPLECLSDLPIEDYRKRVQKNAWKDVVSRIHMLGFSCPFSTTGIDISAPGSAMAVFDRAKKSKQFCAYLSQYMEVLMVSSQITTLHGSVWKAHL